MHCNAEHFLQSAMLLSLHS